MATECGLQLKNNRKDLVGKPVKSDTLKMKQLFKSGFIFFCWHCKHLQHSMFAASPFLFELQLVSLVCDDSVAAASGLGTAACEVSPNTALCWPEPRLKKHSQLLPHVPHLSLLCVCKYPYPHAEVESLPVCRASYLRVSQH